MSLARLMMKSSSPSLNNTVLGTARRSTEVCATVAARHQNHTEVCATEEKGVRAIENDRYGHWDPNTEVYQNAPSAGSGVVEANSAEPEKAV